MHWHDEDWIKELEPKVTPLRVLGRVGFLVSTTVMFVAFALGHPIVGLGAFGTMIGFATALMPD